MGSSGTDDYMEGNSGVHPYAAAENLLALCHHSLCLNRFYLDVSPHCGPLLWVDRCPAGANNPLAHFSPSRMDLGRRHVLFGYGFEIPAFYPHGVHRLVLFRSRSRFSPRRDPFHPKIILNSSFPEPFLHLKAHFFALFLAYVNFLL